MVTASNDDSPSDDRSRSDNGDQSEVSTGVLSAVMEDYIKAVYAIETPAGEQSLPAEIGQLIEVAPAAVADRVEV